MAGILRFQGTGKQKNFYKNTSKNELRKIFLQYNDSNKSHNTKIIRMNFPLHKLDEFTEALLEVCKGLDFPVKANLGSK